MKLCDSAKPIWRKYLAYARSTTTSAAAMPARSTRRLKSSFSMRPENTAAKASSNRRASVSISASSATCAWSAKS